MSAGVDSSGNRFRNLTLSMVALILVNPFLLESPVGRASTTAMMSAIFFFGVVAVSDSRKDRLVALGFGVPWLVFAWTSSVVAEPLRVLDLAAAGLAVGFFSFTVAMILGFLIRARVADADVLWGAVAIYFMLGGLWFSLYTLLELIQPGSFHNGVTGLPAGGNDLVYYSFVTLTTLGYGDIVPTTPGARNLAVLEAVTGVIYLPVVLSRLVSLFVADGERER
jgi:hypothetical protein